MKVLQNFQKFRVLWHGRTELTEVLGTGNTRVNAHPLGGKFDLEDLVQLDGMFSLGQCPQGNLS